MKADHQQTELTKNDVTRKEGEWQGLPYFPISQFYQRRFGEKVYKIPVSTAETCPNREGLAGMKTCIFCDVWGSAAYPESRELELRQQIETNLEKIQKKFKAQKFLVYFQSYTNTYSKVDRLRSQFEVARQVDQVAGFVLGTRPDCISDALFDLWNEYSQDLFVAVELGVQSFDEGQLRWMERGHTAARSLKAIQRIKQKCPRVDLGIHLIFGNPGETDEQIIESAQLVSQLPVDNVKLHNMHVLKNTPLEGLYLAGEYEPQSLELYSHRVGLFLQHLNPKIAVHRLAALAKRGDELVAPSWVGNKMATYQYILNYLRDRGIFQGQLFKQRNEF